MGLKNMSLNFLFKTFKKLRFSFFFSFFFGGGDCGSEFQTVVLISEKDLLSKVSRDMRGGVSNEVSRERSVLEVQCGRRRSEM